MTKLKKSAISILSIACAACLGTGTVAYAFKNDVAESVSASGLQVNRVNGSIDAGEEKFYDSNVIYRLPETVSANDDVSVIISMNVDSVMDAYKDSSYTGSLQAYGLTDAAETVTAQIERERKQIISKLDKSGVKYTLGEKYDTILSGMEITVKASDFAKINGMLEGDAELIVGETYYQAETEVVTNEVDVYETGIFDSSNCKYQGDGVVVAVLDTGCDYTHTAFSVDNFSTANEAFTLSSVSEKVPETSAATTTKGLTGSDVYVSKKIPFAYDYADKDSDVAPINSEHGTHVAGIIAGNDDEITGVAPNAQLAIMKVFSDTQDGAKTSWMLAALEDCVKLGVDVINMSLGSGCGFSREVDEVRVNEIYDSVKEAGISLIAAAANSYNATFGSSKNGSLGLTSNPDSGTVGSPSTYAAALSIASVDGVKTPYLKYNDDIIYFTEASNSSAETKHFVDDILKTVDDVDSYDFEYVTIPGVGRSSDYIEADEYYQGKIVLVKRGDTTFEDKVRVALKEKGASGIIIYNNVSGTISMSVGKDMGAVCSISQDEGEKLAKAGTGILKISREQVAGPFMSDFSSWGPTSDLKIKPEITAHGGEIYSCVPGQGYDRLSGTSMAAPNQAGATALIRQYVKDNVNVFGQLSTTEVTARVNQLMMSTADIVYNKNGLPYAVRKQGAGLMNIMAATNSASYITTYEYDGENVIAMDKTKLELGDDAQRTGVYEMEFTVNNISSSSVTYGVDALVMTEGVSTTYTSHGDTTVTQDGYMLNGRTVEITSIQGGTKNGLDVTVNAGSSATISLKITLSDEDKSYLNKSFAHGMYVEGFVTLKAKSGTSVNMNVPMLAFYGDWTEAPIFDEEYYDTNKDELNKGLDDEDKLMADAYATRVTGGLYSDYISTLGTYYFIQNPLDTPIPANKEHIALSNYQDEQGSSINSIRSISAGMLRNAKQVDISIVEDSTGKEIFSRTEYNQRKSYSSGSTIYGSSIDVEFSAIDYNLKNNTKYTVTVSAYIDYGTKESQKNVRNTFTFPLYIDYEAPIVTGVAYRTEYDRTTKKTKLYADLSIYDNHYAMSLQIGQVTRSDTGLMLSSFGKYMTPIYSEFNSTSLVTVELTDYISQIKNSCGYRFNPDGSSEFVENSNTFVAICYDYAKNSATYEIPLPDEIISMYYEQEGQAIDEIKLSPNETLDLSTVLKIYPEESWIDTLDFVSGDSTVADVINHTLIAKSSGTTVITATGRDAQGNKISTDVKVTVLKEGDEGYVGGYSIPEVNKFTLKSYYVNKAYYGETNEEREIGETGGRYNFGGVYSLSMYPSESVTINYELDSYFPEKTGVVYTVGNARIASVSDKGEIVALSEGSTIVTASVVFDGKTTLYSERISITVKDPFKTNSIYLVHYKGLGGEVKIPEDRGVTTIQAFAFSNYKFIEKDPAAGDVIDKEDPYFIKQWYIGEDTITKVIIPEGVEEIQQYAFANLTALEEVVLPTTLKKIGVGAFLGCTKLKKINLENAQFINKQAFSNCALEEIDLSSVVSIGTDTFANNKLVSLTLPKSAQSLGEGAFKNNAELTNVQFNASKIKIAPYVFADCIHLLTVNINASVVPSYAFSGCTNLNDVRLGKDVAVIGEYAFAGTNVAKFTLAQGNSVFTLNNEGTEIYCGEQLILRAPAVATSVLTIEATEIATGAFAGNKNIMRVYAPNVTSVGAYAFADCEKLVQVEMPKLIEIGERAFYNTALEQTPDLNAVSFIGEYAFARTDLISVTIPANTQVGEGAFYNCNSLKSVTVGANAVIGDGAFSSPIDLLTYEETGLSGVFNYFYTTYSYAVKNESGEVVENLTFYRFDINSVGVASSNLQTVVVGDNVKLGAHAFAGNTKLSTITFGNATVIGDYAFFNDKALTSVDLSKVTSVGAYAFSGSVTYDYLILSTSPLIVIRARNFTTDGEYYYSTEDINTYFAPSFEQADVSNATKIGEGAFAFNQKLSQVKLGSLTDIAAFAFASCSSIEEITIPETVTQIGAYAFNGASVSSIDLSYVEVIMPYAFADNALTVVTLKEGAQIGYGAFASNYDLATVTNLDKAIYIDGYAFYGSALEKIKLDALYIGDFAFAQSAVTEVELGANVVELGENPFFGCAITTFGKVVDVEFNGSVINKTLQETYDVSETVKVINGVLYQKVANGLELICYPAAKADESFTVENGTTRISANAFAYARLKNVTLARTLQSIGDKAFYGCENLKTVIFLSYYAPALEEAYSESYANTENVPYSGNGGLGIYKYYMWNVIGDGFVETTNFYYGANFVDYIGHLSDNIVMVKPANGKDYDTFIFSQYFKTVVLGSNAAMDSTLEVIDMISAIPASITLSDKAKVEAARAAYNSLSSLEQQALVTNYTDLTNAERVIAYLESREPVNPVDPVQPGDKNDSNVVAYIGYAVAGVAVIALVAYIVVTNLMKKKSSTVAEDGENQTDDADSVDENK